MVKDIRHCASWLWCTQLCMARHVHNRCFLQCGVLQVWVQLRLAEVLQVQHMVQLHCLSGRQVCGCSGSYICGDMFVKLDSIWVMLMNVVMSTSILSTADDLDDVQSMVCCMDDGGREQQASGIIENGYGMSGKQWGFLLLYNTDLN